MNTYSDVDKLTLFYNYDHLDDGLPSEVLGGIGSHLMDPHPNVQEGYVNRHYEVCFGVLKGKK